MTQTQQGGAQLRQAAEDAYAEEIAALNAADDRPRPPKKQLLPWLESRLTQNGGSL